MPAPPHPEPRKRWALCPEKESFLVYNNIILAVIMTTFSKRKMSLFTAKLECDALTNKKEILLLI